MVDQVLLLLHLVYSIPIRRDETTGCVRPQVICGCTDISPRHFPRTFSPSTLPYHLKRTLLTIIIICQRHPHPSRSLPPLHILPLPASPLPRLILFFWVFPVLQETVNPPSFSYTLPHRAPPPLLPLPPLSLSYPHPLLPTLPLYSPHYPPAILPLPPLPTLPLNLPHVPRRL